MDRVHIFKQALKFMLNEFTSKYKLSMVKASTYVCSQKFGYFGQWLSSVNTLEMKNFDTHLVFICNTFNYKPKVSMKPQNAEF